VLLSFHVRQGKHFVPDLKAGAVALLEDGKPRPFTIFDSAATQGGMQLKLFLDSLGGCALAQYVMGSCPIRMRPPSDTISKSGCEEV
jgi:hypothetical protein